MGKMKVFDVVYRAEVKRTATVMARDEKEARKKFDAGDFDEGYEIDCIDIDDVCIREMED